MLRHIGKRQEPTRRHELDSRRVERIVGARWQARGMAGGMNKRGGHSYGAMAERIAATGGERQASVDPTPLERLRHCWVIDEDGRRRALLLEWRQVGDVWQGRVGLPVLEDDRWEPAEVWLPAEEARAVLNPTTPGQRAGGIGKTPVLLLGNGHRGPGPVAAPEPSSCVPACGQVFRRQRCAINSTIGQVRGPCTGPGSPLVGGRPGDHKDGVTRDHRGPGRASRPRRCPRRPMPRHGWGARRYSAAAGVVGAI